MKYLFINSVAGSGSTGKIAALQCRILQKQGHQCILAYGRWKSNCDDLNTYKIGTALDYKLHGIYTRLFDKHGFGSKAATRKFLEWVQKYNPDVIWLHNIHGYYLNIEILFDYLKAAHKIVFWTLHDCWSFTGHCACFTYMQCDKWKKECFHCTQKSSYPKSILFNNSKNNYERKRKSFCGVSDMTLITPSQWLADLVKKSYLKEYPIKVVRNEIDKNTFKPTYSNFREKYELEDKIILLGVASTWGERKGFKDYLMLAKMLTSEYKIVLVGLNKKQMKNLPANVLGISRTENTKHLAEIYTAADIFINLSYEENYPTVNLEAQACGTPIIAYDVGGTKETFAENANRCQAVSVGNLNEIIKTIKAFSVI